MATIGLVACASKKVGRRVAAKDLYVSSLFAESKRLAESRFDRWYILSAKHGVLEPARVISPYDQTLKLLSIESRTEWARRAFEQLSEKTDAKDELVFLAGSSYREELLPLFKARGNRVSVPMEGMSIGRQVQWLQRMNRNSAKIAHLDRFYVLLNKLSSHLGGGRRLSESSGSTLWPERGVYFFLEPGEFRAMHRADPRVVRVGTHTVSKGSQSTLWNRLRTHRGGLDRSGSHRSSVFRLHVGAAILKRDQLEAQYPSWGKGSNADADIKLHERQVEEQVSEYIGRMTVLWLPVEDVPGPQSDRAYLESNSIALLAGQSGPLDPCSSRWLGCHSPHDAIRQSSLWNVNHVAGEYAEEFLDVLEQYVAVAGGEREQPDGPLAPRDWHQRRHNLRQDSLF